MVVYTRVGFLITFILLIRCYYTPILHVLCTPTWGHTIEAGNMATTTSICINAFPSTKWVQYSVKLVNNACIKIWRVICKHLGRSHALVHLYWANTFPSLLHHFLTKPVNVVG